MPTHLAAIVNMKGGVGKSTTTMMLAEGLASLHGKRVLVLDLDPQASCSIMLAGQQNWLEARRADKTIDVYFSWEGHSWPKGSIVDFLVADASDIDSARGVDLAPSSPELRYVERDMVALMVERGFKVDMIEAKVRDRLRAALKRVEGRYDFVLVDCPPGISMFSEAAIMAADVVLTPSIPDYVSRLGLLAFSNRALRRMGEAVVAQERARRLMVLATKFEDWNPLHVSELKILRTYEQESGWTVLKTVIDQHRDVARAGERLEPGETRSFERKYGECARNAGDLVAEFLSRIEALKEKKAA